MFLIDLLYTYTFSANSEPEETYLVLFLCSHKLKKIYCWHLFAKFRPKRWSLHILLRYRNFFIHILTNAFRASILNKKVRCVNVQAIPLVFGVKIFAPQQNKGHGAADDSIDFNSSIIPRTGLCHSCMSWLGYN